MLSVSDEASYSHALGLPIDDRLQRLLRTRRTQLGYDAELSEMAHLVIVQAGDSPADLERQLGFSVFQNPADGSRFDGPDFTPGWEWIEDHGFCFELVFILDDSGFAHVVFVEKAKGVDPRLLELCAAYASEHA